MPESTTAAIFSHLRPQGKFQPIAVRDARERIVGDVRSIAGRQVFFRRVDARLHQLREPPAWAQDKAALDAALRAGAVDVLLVDSHAGKRWTAPVDAFFEYGLPLDRGHGVQLALPVERWRCEDLREPAQMDLFAAVLA